MCVSMLRPLALLALAALLAGCAATAKPVKRGPDPVHVAMYGAHPQERFPLPATDIARVDPKYLRQQVAYPTAEPTGTIVIDTQNRFLYLVQENGMAMRYGIGVGKEGFEWKGTTTVAMKREWPVWTPPAAMIKRRPDLAKWRGGMPGGPENALGARAMYLFNKGGDSGYRLHGTPEWSSIGKAMSSGCIRLMNQDVIDLYERVKVGAKVIVM